MKRNKYDDHNKITIDHLRTIKHINTEDTDSKRKNKMCKMLFEEDGAVSLKDLSAEIIIVPIK